MKPEISVITTNYNHKQYLRQSVESILNQQYPDFELIIIDDCSTDGSQDLIHELAKEDKERIRTIFLKENRGKWYALNTAIKAARGSLVTLCDADDASCPERLGRQRAVIKNLGSRHNLCGFTHCWNQEDMDNALKWKSNGEFGSLMNVMHHYDVTKVVHKGLKTPGINHYYVGPNYEVHGASSMFYKQLWDNGMRFLPDSLGLRVQFAEDSDHNTRMTLLLQRTSVLMEPLYVYRRLSSTNDAYLKPK